ncbi:MAG TPA: class I SAM-dependent methyltransferase [Candidatus Saccharimonadales bacterium]|nr:class I SAM-dependent methyltransferase [Candidatus Saccharimonadales bacterium]
MKGRMHLVATLLNNGADPSQILIKMALRRALQECQSVLDVGCGFAPTLRQLGVPHCVGLEGYQPAVEEARRRKTQDEIIHGNAGDLTRHFQPGQFDACIAMDVIEHLPKEAGLKLMRDMELIARKKVVFFTPNGFLHQSHSANDDLEEHLSGWEPEEMTRHGYRVFGMLGAKGLRGEYHALKRRPRFFWGFVSLLSQALWVHHQPEKATAILCVKDVANSRF